MKFFVSIPLLLTLSTPLVADSLLDRPTLNAGKSSPSSQYKMKPRTRQSFDYRVHDTITVKVSIDDTISFTKKQDTKRDTSWEFAFKSFIDNFAGVTKTSLPDFEIESAGENKTKGNKQDGNRIRLDVSCEIIEILPQGDLVIEGTRFVKSDEDQATVKVAGRVNPKYINPNTDTVFSERILQLEVKTDYDGPLADNEKRGFVSKLLDKFKIF